jgi:hypothetical protein
VESLWPAGRYGFVTVSPILATTPPRIRGNEFACETTTVPVTDPLERMLPAAFA